MTRVGNVEVVNWNPRRYAVPPYGWLRFGPRVNNFGDLIGPRIVEAIAQLSASGARSAAGPGRLLAVGSIMHFAADGDVIWGTGVNGKVPAADHRATRLDVRAVRGPLTREWLWKHKRIESPAVYGDPALLLPTVQPWLAETARNKVRALAVVPNFHDAQPLRTHPAFVDPQSPLETVLTSIAQSESVVGSSLHAIIVAETLGIPAMLVRPRTEPPFKYLDYARGTGRAQLVEADSVDDAERSVRTQGLTALDWSRDPLMAAFPSELWPAA